MTIRKRPIDVLCVGEILIDFIANQSELPLEQVKDYHRYLGGSPTNVAMNISRLGMQSEMVATIGNDGLGDYIEMRLDENNVGKSKIRRSNSPTSVIFVSRTANTPEFISYRGADKEISEGQIPASLLQDSTIFHTSCFALSKKPARETILVKAKEAYHLGCQLSIDINFSEKIWSKKERAIEIVKSFCQLSPLVKVSQDDMDRLFGYDMSHTEIFKNLHDFGAKLICLTLGKQGAKLSQRGKKILFRPAIEIEEIKDATGAGDAFWSGFLYAWLKNKTLNECLETALQTASIKLQNVGRIPNYEKFLKQ